jgi:hypothetical protein
MWFAIAYGFELIGDVVVGKDAKNTKNEKCYCNVPHKAHHGPASSLLSILVSHGDTTTEYSAVFLDIAQLVRICRGVVLASKAREMWDRGR